MTIVIKRFDFGRLLKDVCEFLLVDYETAPRQIRDDFMRLLHQPLQRLLKGRIRFTERDDKIGQQLTTRARIDAVLRHQEFGYFGIGIHIQYGVGDRTFIIRRHRKYPEFMRFADDARDADASFQFNIAKYIVHAIIDEETGEMLNAAIAFTRDVYDCIDKRQCDLLITGNVPSRQTTDYLVAWDTLRNNGMWIYEFNENEEAL